MFVYYQSHGVWRHYRSLSAIICECGDTTWSVCPYRVSIYMECGGHSTLCNIHMDTNMDMDTQCFTSHMQWGDLVYYISGNFKNLVKSLNFEM